MSVDDVIRRQLKALLEVRNSFVGHPDRVAVANYALDLAQTHVPSQVVALFLFDKAGGLARLAISGWDRDGKSIENTWFASERYEVGESFTGLAAEPPPGGTHGVPQWSNDLDMLPIKPENRATYMERLDCLSNGVAIPLNGRFRTFGVLRVLNRYNAERTGFADFDEEDILWLAHIGNSTAAAMSTLRREDDFRILASVGGKLIVPFKQDADLPRTYNEIAAELVGPLTNYRAALIRVGGPNEMPKVVGKSSDGVPWDGWVGEPAAPGGIVHDVLESGKPVIVDDITTQPERFRNLEWMQANHLHGYLCFPLLAPEGPVGTLSLFTSFPYQITPAENRFVENIASLTAAFVESTKLVEAQDERVARAHEEVSKNSSTAARATLRQGHRRMRDVKHEYKNHLYTIMRDLKEAEETDAKRRPKLIRRALEYVRARHQEVSDELAESSEGRRPAGLDINTLIDEVVSFINTASRRRSIQVETRLGDRLPVLAIDPDDIRHALNNLLDNAIKAVQHSHERDGRIIVESRLVYQGGREFIQVSVEDNGIGVRKDHEEKIYNEGFTTYDQGTGVGLYNTREIMKQYGGTVKHMSTYGRGSTFFLRIPTRPFELEREAW